MAGAGIRVFQSGEVLTASNVNTYLQDQVVARFADSTARTNAYGGTGEPTLAEGMLSYLDSDNTVYVYDGSAWRSVVMSTVVDAKGDLLVGTADDSISRLAVGANDRVLMAASGETTGLKWGGTYTSYTPTLTNVTLGNGVLNGAYVRIGDVVIGGVHLVFGTTTSVSGLMGISLPFTVAGGANSRTLPRCAFGDPGVNTHWGVGVIVENATKIDFYAENVTTTYSYVAATSATVPHTWGNTDELYCGFWYRAA